MDKIWRAFYTRPKHEKKVNDRLTEQGYTVFCPLTNTRVRWSDRWKNVYKPVLPGYIFAHVNEHQRHEILQDPSILNTVYWNKKPAVIRDEEIVVMQYLLYGGDEEGIQHFNEGDLISIRNGDFRGMKGIVIRVEKRRVSLRLEGLQLDFVVQIPARMARLET